MAGLRIGIAGAGMGGLAAAAALARRGHRVCLHDRFDRPRPVGSGLVIQPVERAVLADIGAALGAWKEEASALWPDFAAFLAEIDSHDRLTPAFYSHGTLRRPVAKGIVHIDDSASVWWRMRRLAPGALPVSQRGAATVLPVRQPRAAAAAGPCSGAALGRSPDAAVPGAAGLRRPRGALARGPVTCARPSGAAPIRNCTQDPVRLSPRAEVTPTGGQ